MRIQINSDRQVGVNAAFVSAARERIESALERFQPRITRVEVHLSDVNSASKRGFPDKRCFVEVRPAGEKPVVVANDANELEPALRGAANKLKRLLSARYGKQAAVAKRSQARPVKRKNTAGTKPVVAATRAKQAPKKRAVKNAAEVSARGPKKMPISQQRRKVHPARRGH